MRFVLGRELQRIREYVSCPQLGDDHYGPWGALPLEHRIIIARMVETIEQLDQVIEQFEIGVIDPAAQQPAADVEVRHGTGTHEGVKKEAAEILVDRLTAEVDYWKRQAFDGCMEKGQIYRDASRYAVERFAARLCEGRVSNDPVVIAVETELKMRGDNNG